VTLGDLKDVEFINASPDDMLAALLEEYTSITERTLAKGDPVRLFLMVIAEAFVRLRNEINYAGKMNLLKYAEGDYLDHLGALTDTTRLEATAAVTTIKVTLSNVRERDTDIPAGIRISNGDKLYFALTESGVIPKGETEIFLPAKCLETGDAGNDYMAGEIKTIVDPIPYVTSMANTTKTEGGAERESDIHYRERIHEAPEKFSNAGSYGAYRYWAMTASSLIVDVEPYSNEELAGIVRLYVLLENGEIPGDEILNMVYDAVNAEKIRPLTDKVECLPPKTVSYDLEVEYYIKDTADVTAVQKAAETAVNEFVLWQKSKLGRDINTDELIYKLKSISGIKRIKIKSPDFVSLQSIEVAVANNISLTLKGREDE